VSDLIAIGLGGVVGAATAALAQRTESYYHDAVRPLAREVRSGKTSRAELSTYTWGVSWRFVAFFAAPFALLTGAVVSHLLFLPAEALAIRLAHSAFAAAAGAVLGAAAVALTIGLHELLGEPSIGLETEMAALVEPVLWLYPLVPVLAALKLPRNKAGTAITAGAAALAAAVTALAGAEDQAGPAAATAATIALIALHLATTKPGAPVPLAAIGAGSAHIRRGLPLLLVAGAGVAALAAYGRLAGDPLAAVLIGSGHVLDAAVVALLIGLAFLPLVAVSSVASDSYSTQGTPDVIPAAGYLLSSVPGVAAVAGALLMAGEIGLRRRFMRLVMSRPIVSELATALRDAIGDVALLGLLVGGLSLAGAVAGPIGFLVAGAAWLLNEQVGRPVTRLAVTPAAAILVAVGAEIWRTIT
jgi:hypothetical protein